MQSTRSSRISRIGLGFIVAVNLFCVAWYLLHEEIAEHHKLAVAAVIGPLVLLGSWRLFAQNWPARFFAKVQISLFSLFLVCASLQLVYFCNVNLLPTDVQNRTEHASITEMRQRVVQFLEHSPYAKPRPNTTITVPGYYGPEDDFVYTWTTDQRGYKNSPGIAARKQVPIVAVGDSFTEGLGVKAAEAWAGVLTSRGYPCYSMGVQGYSPSQIAATFKHFGTHLNPKIVVVGYLERISRRETYFMRKEQEILKDKKLPSAIGRLVEYDGDGWDQRGPRHPLPPPPPQEIRRQFKYVITSIVWSLREHWWNWQSQVARQEETVKAMTPDAQKIVTPFATDLEDARFMPEDYLKADGKIQLGLMQRYRREVAGAMSERCQREERQEQLYWQRTEQAINSIIDEADKSGAKVIVLMLYGRGPMYCERATGEPLPANAVPFVEAALLRELCQQKGAVFLDTRQHFLSHIGGLEQSTPITEYPYLRYDGHPSPRGHELIADVLTEYLDTHYPELRE